MIRSFSIRYKILAVTTFLLVTCLGVYLLIATEIIRSDKREVVFDFNRSRVKNLASDANAYFGTVFNYLSLMAHFSRLSKDSKEYAQVIALVERDENLVYLGKSDSTGKWTESYFLSREFLETYAITGKDQRHWNTNLNKITPPPLADIKQQGHAIWPVASNPPLIGLGKMVIEEDGRRQQVNQYMVIGYVKMDRFLENMSESGMGQNLITNQKGEVLVISQKRQGQAKIKGSKSFGDSSVSQSVPTQSTAAEAKSSELKASHWRDLRLQGVAGLLEFNHLIELAKKSRVKLGVLSFGAKNNKFLGAYTQAYNGLLFVFTKISYDKAFGAVSVLVSRSLKFALIIITASFLVAIFFSRSLTRPIESLVGAMKRVAAGDLSTQIELKGKDEIGWLATSFNTMTTDLKGSRDALDSLNKNLESKVFERTEQLNLQNQAVKEAQEALLKTSRLAAVGEVAGQTAHEVLNPLTSLISRVEKMQERVQASTQGDISVFESILTGWETEKRAGGFENLVKGWQQPIADAKGENLWDEDMRNFRTLATNWQSHIQRLDQDAQFLLQEGQRIHRIMDSMRTLNHSNGELKLCSMHDLILRSVNIMSDLAALQGADIKLSCSAGRDSVMADKDEFIQSITNLIRNSLQAISGSEVGRGEVHIITEEISGQLHISVKDNGVGISEKDQKRLFELHFSTKAPDEGTGLGLNISRRFIRRFQGDLYLEKSTKASGTTFVVRLPLVIDDVRGVAV